MLVFQKGDAQTFSRSVRSYRGHSDTAAEHVDLLLFHAWTSAADGVEQEPHGRELTTGWQYTD